MKNRDKKIYILIFLIMLLISMLFVLRKNNIVYKDTNKSNKATFAIMVENEEGRYINYNGSTWPKIGYAFNSEKTTCVDKDDNNLGNLVEFDNRTHIAIMRSKKTAFCTLFFDKDNSAPDGSFYIGTYEGQQYTNNVYEEIHITIDAEDTAEYCLTDVEDSISCTNKWKTLPVLEDNKFKTNEYNFGEDGEKILYLYLKDGASNISQVKEDDIVLDTTAPECIIGGNSNVWTNEEIKLTQNGIDKGEGTVYYSWDNKNNYSTTKVNKTVNSNGTYTMYVKDGLGNETSCNVTINKIDKQPPSCSISANPTSITNGYVTLTGSGTDSGEGNVYYKWDSGSYGTVANTNKTKTVTKKGTYTLYVKDGLGNERNCNITINNIVGGFRFKYDGGFTYQDGTGEEVTTYKDNTIEREIEITQDTWKIKLLTSGTLKVQEINSNVDVFLVGGGGGGAKPYVWDGKGAGGGGGGGYTKTVKNIAFIGDHIVTIGEGGEGGKTNFVYGDNKPENYNGKSGGTTTVSNCPDCDALGGSGGMARNGGDGGSGGGGGSFTYGGWQLNGDNPTCKREEGVSQGGYDGSDGTAGKSNAGSTESNPCQSKVITSGGAGQGTTTREFGEETGKMYAGGGNGACAFYALYGDKKHYRVKVIKDTNNSDNGGAISYQSAEANTGGGGGGGVLWEGTDLNANPGSGGSGIVVIRNTR